MAALYLRCKGYRILGTRVRRAPIEVDLLARSGQTLVLVEVKYRATLDQAVLALTPSAIRRLARMAELVAADAAWRRRVATNVRVDLIALAPWAWPRHIRGVTP
jgi:putative endonuclease